MTFLETAAVSSTSSAAALAVSCRVLIPGEEYLSYLLSAQLSPWTTGKDSHSFTSTANWQTERSSIPPTSADSFLWVTGIPCEFPTTRDVSDSNGARFSLYMLAYVFKFLTRGWDVGIASMSVGEKAVLVLSPGYGCGDEAYQAGSFSVPANATLIYEVCLIA